MSPKQTRGGFHHEANGVALHATFPPPLPGCGGVRSSPVIWQSGEAALFVSTSCGNDTADLPLFTNEARRGWWEPSEVDSPPPWGREVEHWSSVADLEYRNLPPEGACQVNRPHPRGTEVRFRVPGNVSDHHCILDNLNAWVRMFVFCKVN